MTIKHPNRIYNKYLARDKFLRHVYQHLEIGTLTFIIFFLITKFSPTPQSILIFILFTYLPDLDGTTSCFIWQFSNPVAHEVVARISKLDIRGSIAYGTVHHKKLNRLLIHNIIVHPLIIYFLIKAIQNGNYFWASALAALTGHITFDFFDDIFQMGHIKNYLWPLHVIFPKSSLFDSSKIFYPIPQYNKKITTEPIDYIFKSGKVRKEKSKE